MTASRLILASTSPRRRALLAAAGVGFELAESGVVEEPLADEPAGRFAQRMAEEKALAVSRRAAGALVLGADTVVLCEGEILGKPRDEADARRMLRALSGRFHTVVTAFALARDGRVLEGRGVTSRVRFRELDDDEIAAYVGTGEPMDKAGAYGIQAEGAGLVVEVEGARDNVMGLPVGEVLAALRCHGVALKASEDRSDASERAERSMLTQKEIASRLDAVRERIARAAGRAGRDAAAVRLVLASKTQPLAAIRAAYAAGAREFGENYVQEAAAKQDELCELPGLRWHLIGHLQTNKAREAAGRFALVHSLDSARLAAALGRARSAPPVPVLIEVNAAGEASKSGVAPAAVERLIDAARGAVEITGLMTIPPPAPEAERSRKYFAELRRRRDRLAATTGLALSELSMGMTDDYEVAIEEGATIVRVGRAVFGERAR